MDLAAAKAAVRQEALARRERITDGDVRAFALRLATIGVRLVEEYRPDIVSAFSSIGAEPWTTLLLATLAEQGVATALPVIEKRGMPLTFRLWKEGDPVVEAKWGIKEPLPSAPEVFPDLLFVPLAAYDRKGNRIGYGAGFYDRTLARLRAMKKITAVGVAYHVQEMPEVPTDATDEKLDFILTDQEWIACR
ncbi:MAG TPA: 5-formyltetrahydrofolate cyclo-ligase [Methylovirgula sp.]